MDIIDFIGETGRKLGLWLVADGDTATTSLFSYTRTDIPSFERKKTRYRRAVAIATGILAGVLALEKYNGGVSRAVKSLKR